MTANRLRDLATLLFVVGVVVDRVSGSGSVDKAAIVAMVAGALLMLVAVVRLWRER